MAITASNVTNATGVGTSSATITTSAFTSVANNYYVVSVVGGTTVTGVTSTNGITFSLIKSQAAGTNTIYVYGGLCTAGSSGTISITKSSSTIYETYSVDMIAGAATSAIIVQSANAANTYTTLAAFGSTSNGAFLVGSNYAAMTIKSGWTQLFNSAWTLLTGYIAVNDTGPSYASSLNNPGIIAFEVAGVSLDIAYGTAPGVNSLSQMGIGY